MSGRVLPPLGSDRAWSGGPITPYATAVLAPNPGPMTLDGTNTWLLHAPGSEIAAVLDPGPDDPAHLRAVLAAAEDRGVRVVATLLTHGHPDHAEGARSFAALAGTGVRALDPAHRFGDEGLADGDVIAVGDLEVAVVGTPGHTADCLTFHLPQDGSFLTGDTVLGRGSTVVAWPDGRLGDYLDSLARLRDLAAARGVDRILPGHGPDLPDAPGVLDAYLAHRHDRLDQVREAVAAGARTPAQVVELVYADVPRMLWPAAELSVRAQLHYLDRG